MKGRIAGILFAGFLLINLCFCMSANAVNSFVIKQIIPDSAGKLILVTGSGNSDFDIKVSKSIYSSKIIVDVQNSMLLGLKRTVKINNEKIKDFRIAQFSTEPNTVRMVLTANSVDVLKKIKITKSKNTVLFDLNETVTADISQNPLYKDREVTASTDTDNQLQAENAPGIINLNLNRINASNGKEEVIKDLQAKIDGNALLNLKNIKRIDNRVLISGTGLLSLTEPIILENPKRLTFDITSAIISSDELESLLPVNLKNGDLLRIGQFDEKTVRVVIETQKPESYKTVISPDMQSFLIAPENEVSFAEFPDSGSTGDLQDIKIIKQDNKTTKILLTSAKPLIHNIKHYNSAQTLCLEFYNLKQPKKELISSLLKTGQFHGINFERIEKYPDGSKWIFPLNRTAKTESKLSLDGRILEITLKDVMPVITSRTGLKRKIVLDAGHGGAEPGAMRAGIYEKNITADVTKRVRTYLQNSGIKVIMTREGDESVSLKERTIVTNEENPDAFISIHVNSCENSTVRGLETYYYTPQSKELAQNIHAKITDNINSPDRGIRTARFYVIRNTEIPAILAEIGYLSNDSERNEILTDYRKDATAKAISEGILNYLRSKSSNSSSGRMSL